MRSGTAQGDCFMTGMFVIQDGNKGLVEMTETPYDSENLLQTLLADYPNLIAGDQVDSENPRQWLLISREASLPSEEDGAGRWSVDHLFLDQDGIPTLIEVKRSSDTRIRREVVGQMLDYAANAVVYWPVEKVRSMFEANCTGSKRDPEQELRQYLNGRCEPEDFWGQVKTNLEAGKVRMVFVADEIPRELQRIIEFLNTQMDPAEVLGMEIRQFQGKGLKTLVPRVIGQTATKKPPRSSRQWDEQSFFDQLDSRWEARDVETARRILRWAQAQSLRIWWGKGKDYGSFYPMLDVSGASYYLIGLRTGYTTGYIEIEFGRLKDSRQFADESRRAELLKRLNEITGVKLPENAIERYPSIQVPLLREHENLQRFLDTLNWVLEQYRAAEPG